MVTMLSNRITAARFQLFLFGEAISARLSASQSR
jgi:hypothetical protein